MSHDSSRHWRAVVAQQGRVSLEADWNEATAIAAEANQSELLDTIGPAGTPDDGYRITPTTGGDFRVGAGTMYVGGERVWLDADVDYAEQFDWEDRVGDPLWTEPGEAMAGSNRELAYLLLREQEVSAVEDPVLREVALGGPDTTQRARIVQRVVRRPTKHDGCDGAWAEQVGAWRKEGLLLNASTMRLESTARLRVSFEDPGDGDSLCEPEAQGGYLGAENQLIRVQVCDGVDGEASIAWGYDNASFLYRVTEAAIDPSAASTTLTLAGRPVDDHHQPRPAQAVEVLRAAARLTDDDHIAATSGVVAALDGPYNPDTRQVLLPVVLPPEYMNADLTPLLFLRVWEQRLPCPPDTPITLGDTGVVVTLTTTGGEPFHIGDHWMIAVRPTTPVEVQPRRLLDGFEPPDSYRLWACPLAVVGHPSEQLVIEEDCRNHFDDLVDLSRRGGGGCCELTVGPADVRGGADLQAAVDRLAGKGAATLCLRPGTYVLHAPLVLTREHDRLTIEGCNEAAVLEASPEHLKEFLQGLVVLEHADGVTLRGLRFRMPQVPFAGSGGRVAGMVDKAAQGFLRVFRDLHTSIAVRPVHCALLRVERCLFRFTLPEEGSVFAVGIFAASECWGLAVDGCRFLRDEEPELLLPNVEGQRTSAPFHVLIGYLLVPSTTFDNTRRRADLVSAGGTVLPSLLHDAIFRDSLFEGITVPTIVAAELGTTRVESNTVRECYGGFWLVANGTTAKVQALNRLSANEVGALALFSLLVNPVLTFALVVGGGFPMPAGHSGRLLAVAAGSRPPTATEETADATAFLARMAVPRREGQSHDEEDGTTIADVALGRVSDAVVELANSHRTLVAFQRIAFAEAGASVQMRLDVVGNLVDAVVERSLTGAALIVWDNDDAVGTLTLTGNRLRSRSPGSATASILNVDRCTVTGNIVSNEAP